MSWLPLTFGFPAILWGLLALPVIWWLLRLTPPKPQMEIFPPLKILARVLKKEETPHQSPWWLTLLRLLMAALIVMALAEPIWNPRERLPTGGAALALVVDNGWASAPDWDRRVATAERLIADASSTGIPVVLAFTAEKPNSDIGPFDAAAALDKLNVAEPRPVPVDRPAVYARVAAALEALPGASVAVLADGLAADGDEAAFSALLGRNPANVLWAVPDRLDMVGLTAAENEVAGFTLSAIRAPGDPAPRQVTAGAFDDKGRRIADATIAFGPGQTTGAGQMAVPFELRNDFSSIAIDGEPQAAAVRVLDENSKRRRVGLLSQSEADQAQPLLSPLYYISRALQPFADLVEPSSRDLAEAIPQLLEQKPAMIVMADVGTIPDTARTQLIDWVKNGGTLVRFAGSRLAAAGNDEELLPVRLRLGERSHGRRAVLDDAAAGDGISSGRAVRRPQPADRGHCFASDPGRADVRHRRAHLGKPCRRHAAGHRREARQGHAGAVPHHAGGDVVEPADLRQLRRDAAPHRPAVAQSGCGGRQRRRPGRLAGPLPHDRRQWRAGAADAGRPAARRPRRAAPGRPSRTRPASMAPRKASTPTTFSSRTPRSRRWCGPRSQRR